MNSDDKIAKGRDIRGEAHFGCKLSSADVAAIKAASKAGVQGKKLAVAYGVSEGRISTIINGKRRVDG